MAKCQGLCVYLCLRAKKDEGKNSLYFLSRSLPFAEMLKICAQIIQKRLKVCRKRGAKEAVPFLSPSFVAPPLDETVVSAVDSVVLTGHPF